MPNKLGEYIVPVYTFSDEQTAINNGYTEVIRCRDCKYYRWNDCFAEITMEDGKKYYTSYIDSPSEDDYCSMAERREE